MRKVEETTSLHYCRCRYIDLRMVQVGCSQGTVSGCSEPGCDIYETRSRASAVLQRKWLEVRSRTVEGRPFAHLPHEASRSKD